MSVKPVPAIQVAKEAKDDGIVTLSSGYRAKIRPVAAKLLDEVASMVPAPDVPKQWMEDKQREEYNPLDPTYQRQLREATRLRGQRIMEAMVMFGVELVDPMPPLDEWLPKLRLLAKHGAISLEAIDFKDPIDTEFAFKNYIAVSAGDLRFVGKASGLTEPEVAVAVAGFPGDAARSANK
jgi:hypothetical protein